MDRGGGGALFSPWVRPYNYGFRGEMYRGNDTAIFTMLYLILLTLWFHKTIKLIFLKQSSWSKTMHAEHWRKLAWATFLFNFFPIKNKFWTVSWLLIWFSSAILLCKKKSLFLNLYTSSLWVTTLLQVPITTGSVY